jgi:hypothetical protein
MNEHTLAIALVSLAAVLVVGYTVYRAVRSNRLRKRLEDEAWQRHIGKPIPWEMKTRPRPVPSAIERGTQVHQQFEDYYRQQDIYRQQVGRTKRTKVEDHPTTSLFPPSSFDLPSSGWAKEPEDPPFPVGGGGFSGGGGDFGGGGASDSWGSSDSCSSSDSSSGGSDGGGGGDCGGSSD